MLISVHLPKTAGASIGNALEQRFGTRLQRDYADVPMNTPRARRILRAALHGASRAFAGVSDVDCIHGHFLPLKYLGWRRRPDVRFVTWMRDPVERLVSNYYYWKIHEGSQESLLPVHRRMLNEGWSLERFCLGTELRDCYSEYLWGFPLEWFDFIGIVEHFDEDFGEFCTRYLGGSLDVRYDNANPHKPLTADDLDAGLRERIVQYHRRDVALYRHALDLRKQRRAT